MFGSGSVGSEHSDSSLWGPHWCSVFLLVDHVIATSVRSHVPWGSLRSPVPWWCLSPSKVIIGLVILGIVLIFFLFAEEGFHVFEVRLPLVDL